MELGGLTLWQIGIVFVIAIMSSLPAPTPGMMAGSFTGSLFIFWVAAYLLRRGAGWFTRTLLGQSAPP